MDLRQLRYFLAIVDHGGYHRAAEHLLIAQPSLSQAIATLERELGVPLFHRVGRRVVLTEAGADLVPAARIAVRDLDAARDAVLAHRGLAGGRLDLVTMPSPGIEPLTALLRAYTSEHPGIALNVGAAFTPDEVLDQVASAAAEVGIAGSREPLRRAGLLIDQIQAQVLMLVVNPSLWAPPGTTLDRGQLGGQPLIVSHRGSLMRWLVDDVLASGTPARIVAEVGHRTSILPMVLAGLGHAVLPEAWSALVTAAGLRAYRIEPQSALLISLVRRQDRLTPAADAFVRLALDRKELSDG